MAKTVTFQYENGIEVRDRVSGVTGIINARCEWLNGCIRYSIQPKIDKKDPNKMPEGWWIDGAQLEVIGDGLNDKPVKVQRTGGPSLKAPRF